MMRFNKKCSKILYGVAVFVYWFFYQLNILNDFILIYLSHSLRHVSSGNYCRRQVVLQLYKRKNCGRGLSFTVKLQTYDFVIIPNNGKMQCVPVKQLKCCGVPVHKIWVVGILYVNAFQA
jgi:hypothetical protein